MLRAVIVDYSEQMCQVAKERLEEAGIEVAAVAQNGVTAIHKIRETKPDLVLMDIILPHLDGLGVIERLHEEGLGKIKVFVMTSINSPDLMHALNRYDISGFYLKPYDMAFLVKRICTVFDYRIPKEPGSIDAHLSRQVSQWLHKVAVPPHVKGYQFLIAAIAMVVEDPSLINAMTKVIYPQIANAHHTTAACVERNMRHAIEMAWNRCRVDQMEQVFGNTLDVNKDKPNNSEFIAMMADHIRLERMSK